MLKSFGARKQYNSNSPETKASTEQSYSQIKLILYNTAVYNLQRELYGIFTTGTFPPFLVPSVETTTKIVDIDAASPLMIYDNIQPPSNRL